MDCSTPSFPVHHHLPEFAQTHVHWVGDAIKQFGWYQMQFLSSQVGPTLSLCYRSSCVIAFLSPRVPASEQASPVPVFSPCQLHPHSWPATALKERTRRSHFPFLMNPPFLSDGRYPGPDWRFPDEPPGSKRRRRKNSDLRFSIPVPNQWHGGTISEK